MEEISAPLGLGALSLAIEGSGEAASLPVPEPTASWKVIVGPASGGYSRELTAAQNRRLTVRLKDPSEFGMSIDGRHEEAELLDELSTDLHVLWRSAAGVTWNLFRGRIGSSADDISDSEHQMAVTALDYRALLARRRLYQGAGLNTNPSFGDTTAWTGAGGTFESVDEQHQDAGRSGKITPSGAAATVSITGADFDITAGTAVRLSGWFRNAVARAASVRIDWKDSGGSVLSSFTVPLTLAKEEWLRVDADDAAPASTAKASVIISMTGTPPATDILWVDDVRVTTAPEHSSRLTYDDEDQVDIAWDLIADTQARDGGDLGISNGSTPSGVPRDRLFAYGDAVADRIKELAETEDGFDWDIVPESASALTFRTWHEERGVNRGVVLELGGAVAKARREVQALTYANAIRLSGDTTTLTIERQAADIATAEQGRFDQVFGDAGLKTQQAVDDRAHWQMKASQVLTPTWTVTLRQDEWQGPDHIWVGDPVQLRVKSGRLANVDTTVRVYEMTFSPDADGGTAVDLALAGPAPDHRRIPLTTLRRLTELERR